MRSTTFLLATVLLTTSCAATSSRAQQVNWFKSGYYVAGGVGKASSTTSSSEIDSDFRNAGVTGSSTTLDGRDAAWMVAVGYHFESPFAVEVGVTTLGQVESRISANLDPTTQAAFDQAGQDVHPYLGEGVTALARWYPLEYELVKLSAHGGLWYWNAELEIIPAVGNSTTIDKDGLDPVVGIQAVVGLDDRFDLYIGWDRYWLGDFSADVLWLGVQMNVDDWLRTLLGERSNAVN